VQAQTPPPRARIEALRAWLRAQGLHALIVPTADPHLSEYLPEHWALRQWLSGFSGSAGTLVVSSADACLWTDARYWVQAQDELAPSGIRLMRAGAADVPDVSTWLAHTLPAGSTVGIDGRTLSLHQQQQCLPDLHAPGLTLQTSVDPASALWIDRPALPHNPVWPHAAPYACRSRADNLAAVRAAMRTHGAAWHWISTLDDIAWLFNLRGSDIAYNPVFLAYALIGIDTAMLFVQDGVIDAATRALLQREGVDIGHYEQAVNACARIPAQHTILLDPARTTVHILHHLQHLRVVHVPNPSHLLKSRKTEDELAHIRATMEQDGAALCEFFAWLEAAVSAGQPMTEVDVDTVLTQARAHRPHFISPSFPTIAAFNANAAMPHYRAHPESCATIAGDGLLLIDSGGQYLGGTTDITRMVAIGQASDAQRRDCTVVLQGMIALSQAVFPEGITAGALDALARAPIWAAGADYGHGTGHGVGYCMNVHEGPHSIAHRSANQPNTGMFPGMVTSNEPGLYRAGHWGVRIENLLANVPAPCCTEFGSFLRFETLTLCPIDTRCLDLTRLSSTERDWLNAYHKTVRERLEPHVQGPALAWLRAHTEPV